MNTHTEKYLILLSVIAVLLFTFTGRTVVQAVSNGGGAVQTNGDISFYEESTSTSETEDSTENSTADSSSSTTGTLPETGTTTKPAGKLPSTGELVVKSLSISGGVILVVAGILFWLKRKKQADEGKGSRG